jgi:hypothetical protein
MTDSSGHDSTAPAPLGARILAGLIDFLVVVAAAALLLPPAFAYFPILFVLYHTIFLWLVGCTPGKALLALHVRRIAGPPTLPWSLARSSVGLSLVNGFGLGIVAAAFDPARRAPHDWTFGSIVLRDHAALGVPWTARLERWARQRRELYERKTQTLAAIAGVWGAVEWLAEKLKQAADWLSAATAAIRARVKAFASPPLAPPSRTQAATAALGCSALTVAVLVLVPDARDAAQTIASPVAAFTEPRLPAIQIRPGLDGGGTHVVREGMPVEIRAGLETRHYVVDFGDGTPPVNGSFGDETVLSLRHEYAVSTPGTGYDVVLTVHDGRLQPLARAEYRVEFVAAGDEVGVTDAIANGLWWLHRSLQRENHPAEGAIGRWGTQYPVGETALATLAFEVNGFLGRDTAEGIYQETVQRALAYLLSRCVAVPLIAQDGRDPDSNGNGIGIATDTSHRLYKVPLVAMALLASRQPDAIARSGPTEVRGRRYADIVTDMLDYIAYAQYEGDDRLRGGWRYMENEGADLSVVQWPALAMMSAREVAGIGTPEWVMSELREHFLRFAQDEGSGGFGYSGPTPTSIGMTAAGLIALEFSGVPQDDPRVTRAVDFIAQNWGTAESHPYYTMYTVMKAARLRDDPLTRFGDHDWQAEYRQRLLDTQSVDGFWPRAGGYETDVLATAWPVLILSDAVFAESRIDGLLRRLRHAFDPPH